MKTDGRGRPSYDFQQAARSEASEPQWACLIGLDTTIEPRAIPGPVRMQPAVRPTSAGIPFAVSLNSLSLSLSARRGDSECQNRRRTPRDKHRSRTRSPSCVETNGASPVGFACLRSRSSLVRPDSNGGVAGAGALELTHIFTMFARVRSECRLGLTCLVASGCVC